MLPGVNAVPDVTVVYDGTPSNEDEELEDENDEDRDIVHDNWCKRGQPGWMKL